MDSNPVLRQIKLPTGENGVIQPEKYVLLRYFYA